MMYAPIIRSARVRRRYTLLDHEAALLEDIVVPRGRIEYVYLFVVFETGHLDPCWFVSAERQATELLVDGMNHLSMDTEEIEWAKRSAVLCSFEGDRHVNYGASSDWLDPALFEKQALSMYDTKFGHGSWLIH